MLLDGLAVEGEQPGQRQVDGLDLVQVDRIAQATEALDLGLDVDQRLLHLEAVVLLAVRAFQTGFAQGCMEVFKIPIQGDATAAVWIR